MMILKPRIKIGDKTLKSYIDATKILLKKYGRVFLISSDGYTFKTMKVAVETGKISWYCITDDDKKIIILLEAGRQ